jgi:hypothetical protein
MTGVTAKVRTAASPYGLGRLLSLTEKRRASFKITADQVSHLVHGLFLGANTWLQEHIPRHHEKSAAETRSCYGFLIVSAMAPPDHEAQVHSCNKKLPKLKDRLFKKLVRATIFGKDSRVKTQWPQISVPRKGAEIDRVNDQIWSKPNTRTGHLT